MTMMLTDKSLYAPVIFMYAIYVSGIFVLLTKQLMLWLPDLHTEPHMQAESRASESKHTRLSKPLAPRHLLFARLKANWIILTSSVQQRRTRVSRMMSLGSKGWAAMPTQPDCLQSSNKSPTLLNWCRTVEKQGVDRLHGSWSGGCQWRKDGRNRIVLLI